jgi:hypothetical protein
MIGTNKSLLSKSKYHRQPLPEQDFVRLSHAEK